MMDTETDDRRRNALRQCLKRLSNGLGAMSLALKPSLRHDLSPLQDVWKVNLDNNENFVRAAIRINLQGHLERIKPKAGKTLLIGAKEEQYRNAVLVTFNAINPPAPSSEEERKRAKIANLPNMSVTERRVWMDAAHPREYRPESFHVRTRTAQRYFDDAVEQIIDQMLVPGFRPLVPESEEQTERSSALIVDDVPSDPEPLPARSKRPLLLSLIAVAVVAAAVAIPVALSNSGTTVNNPTNAPATTDPVTVESVAYKPDGRSGHDFVFSEAKTFTPTDLAELNGKQGDIKGYADWMLTRGGIYPDHTKLQIGIRGTGQHTSVVTDVQIVKQCREPLAGTLMYSPGAGPSPTIGMYFDLDAQLPVALDGAGGKSYFAGSNAQTIQLVPGEAATLLIDVATKKSYCSFTFNLVINPGGGQPTVTKAVNNNGKPFEVTAIPANEDYNPVFSNYASVYAGGVASRSSGFVSVDPKTFTGANG